MLRIAAKTSLERCRKQAAQSVRHEATQAAGAAGGAGRSGGSGVGKILGVAAGLTTAGVGGTVGYAYYDPEFRKNVEQTVPLSKDLFSAVLGPAKNGTVARKELQGKFQDILPNKVVEPLSGTPAPPKPVAPRTERSVERKPEKKPVEIVPVDVKKSSVPEIPKPAPPPEEVDRARKDIEVRLVNAIEVAEKKVVAAKNSKLKTLQAIDEHSKALKKAVDDGQNANWDSVREALEKSEKLSKADMVDETESRSKLDTLRKVITEGKGNENTTDLPLLLNATETANKFNYQLDELNQLVQKARSESRILNQYKDLIEQSRRQFASELNAVLPDVDLKAKEGKLSEDDLNALITHAHLRVDQLKRQLTDQQIREEQHIARAIEEQRKADSFLAREQLELELRRLRETKDVDVEKKVYEQRSQWERELEQRLRQAAAAHQDHLEQVIRTQKQLHDIEQAQVLEEAVSKERQLHSRQVELALAKLGGIETALQSRVAQDAENRRAKQYWIACQNLTESIVHGSKAGTTIDSRRKPLAKELAVIKEACENDSFVQAVINIFPKTSLETGPYTEQDLKNRFHQVYKLGRRTAKIDDNGGSLWKYVSSYLQSFFMIELPRRFSAEEKIDVNSVDNYELLSRAKYFVENGDYDNAIRVVQLLRGEPARVARDWIADTRTYLETRWLADLLVAHAAVTSIRSIY